MSSAVIEHADVAALPSKESVDRLPLAQPDGWSKARMLRKLVLTAAVWALYVPHLAILKFLGPRFGPIWARGLARVHWLLTFVGAQRSVRGILQELHPNFETQLSVPAILLKHLELKHECFARFKLFNRRQHSGDDSGLIWEVDPEMTAIFDRAKSSPNGLIILGYHFGFFRLSASAIPHIFPLCNAVYVSNRTAHYAGETVEAVADMALETALWADQQTGARMHYLEPERSIVRLYRMLLAGETVALAADGALGKDFLDVSFLNGKLRLPCGWARLAAATGARVLILVDTQIDHRRRRAWIFDHMQVDNDSPVAIYSAVAESARVLERFVRREPWAWHPWQRLRLETTSDGTPLRVITELGREERRDRRATRAVSPATNRAAESSSNSTISDSNSFASHRNGGKTMHHDQSTSTKERRAADLRTGARRVAIVANSFTPYRIYVHGRIVREVPEVELWTVATHGNSYNRWQGLEPPAEIRPVNFGKGEPTIEQTKLRFALREWRKFGRIIRWLDEHKIEAVICQGFGDVGRLRLLRWCRCRGIPCFLTADCNICGDVRPGPKRALKHLVVEQAIRWSSGVMPCGEYGRLLFERYGATRDQTFMFPLIPDLQLFANPPSDAMRQVQQEYGFNPQRRRIIYCGRMMQVKRPDLTVSAFVAVADQRPEWDLVLVGDGVLRETTIASVPLRLRDRVKWLGLVHDTKKMASIFAQCDVLVLPSDKEPWGLVVIEAAAAGLALVTTDIVGACPELVSDRENGRVFPPGNLHAFIDVLNEVTHPARIDEMKANSRRVLARWMAESDPVDGFRAAMASCGLIPRDARQIATGEAASPLSPVIEAANKVAIEV